MNISAPSCDDIARLLNEQRLPRAGPRWLSRLFGVRDEPIRVHKVNPAGFEDLFSEQRIFYVVVRRLDALPLPALPGGTLGYFAYDGRTLRLLSPSLNSVGQALRREGVPLDALRSGPLARFICAVALHHRDATGHDLVTSADELARWGGELVPYRLNDREYSRVAASIVPPSVVRNDGDSGWRITFTTLFGWMHQKQELGVETLDASNEFELTRRPRRVLSKHVFKQTPAVIY
jgi:hypothetical protein